MVNAVVSLVVAIGVVCSIWVIMSIKKKITINLNRDSVHQGNDIVSHAKQINVAESATVKNLIEEIRQFNYLPQIIGGNATWIIDCLDIPNGVIGVYAQQWSEPKLAIEGGSLVSQLVKDGKVNLHFRY
jgi:hypothetical protein